MSEGLEFEELMNAPRMRMFRKLGEHLRTRVRGLAVLFLFGFVVGYPIAGEGIDWIINQSSLIPDGTQIVVLQPLELVLLRLQIAGYIGIMLVVMSLIWDAARHGKNLDIGFEIGSVGKGLWALAKSLTLALAGLLYAWEIPVSYTHLRAHETREDRVWRVVV